MKRAIVSLVHAWLVIDFFGRGRREHREGSTLTTTIFAQSFVGLVAGALLFGPDAALVPFVAANLSLSTLLFGLGALGRTDRRDRELADRALIGTAPVPRAVWPLARALHSGFQLGLVTIGVALPPAILSGFLRGGNVFVVFAYLLVAVVLAGTLAGALSLAMRILAARIGARGSMLAAGSARALLLAAGTVAFALCLSHLDETADALPGGRAAALSWPPYWAARWLAAPIGGAVFGLGVFGLGALVLGAALLVGDRASTERSRVMPPRHGPLNRLENRLAGGGALLAATTFTSTMMRRSTSFRARVLPLLGVPAALALLASGEAVGRQQQVLLGVTLQFPAIYLPFLVMFLPYVDQPAAGHVFVTSPRHDLTLAREGALIALAVRVLLPIHVLAIALSLALGFEASVAIGLPAFSWGLAVLVAALSMGRLEFAPFTVAEGDEPAPDLGGMIGPAMVLAVLGGGFALIPVGVVGPVAGLALAAVAVLRLGRGRRRFAR